MLQNLTNFFNLIKTRKIKTQLEDSDLIAVGTRDNTWSGNYQPSAITFEDLQNQLGGNISLTTVGTGGASAFAGGVLNIPVYQTQIPHLEYNLTEKTVWNNGLGNDSANTGFGEGVLKSRTSGSGNTGFGYLALWDTTTGSSNTAIGASALTGNSTGSNNVAVGQFAISNNSTGSNNTAVGWGTACPNFSGCVILGREAAATANNQFVVGSPFVNAGTITKETITPTHTWTVRINGANYKIPLEEI